MIFHLSFYSYFYQFNIFIYAKLTYQFNFTGEPLISVFLYDTISYHWSAPNETCEFQEDHPGPRYGHTTTLIDMHVKIKITAAFFLFSFFFKR